mgnify:CR=1 FL=1
MDGQISDLMVDIGTKARAAAAELAYAGSERKVAALIGAADAVLRASRPGKTTILADASSTPFDSGANSGTATFSTSPNSAVSYRLCAARKRCSGNRRQTHQPEIDRIHRRLLRLGIGSRREPCSRNLGLGE